MCKRALVFSFFVSLLAFFSCSDDVVPSPTMDYLANSVEGVVGTLEPPQNVTATQGGKQQITVSWDSVSKAVRYYIYAAPTEFESFVQVGESPNTSFKYENLAAGVNRYIKVRAVDYEGNLSKPTAATPGSTLAQPIISNIVGESEKEDSTHTVYWYMENADKYSESLRYIITCADSSGKTLASYDIDASSLKNGTRYDFDELAANESYAYTVAAYLSGDEKSVETSDTVTAATARKLRPGAPEELTASQGISLDGVTLRFKLPEEVSVLLAADKYEQYPLYFKIYRRIADENNDENSWGDPIVSHLYFTGELTEPSNEKSYVVGTEIEWTNEVGSGETDIERGVKYEYKVQSYADNIQRVITSDLSASTATGWTAQLPSFEVKGVERIPNDDKNAYQSTEITFSADWKDDSGEAWKFVLEQTYAADLASLDNGTATKTYTAYDSIEDFNAATQKFNFNDTNAFCGYYTYTFYIVKAADYTEGKAPENPLAAVSAHNTIVLTKTINIPEFPQFAAQGGYKDKVILSWEEEADCAYTLRKSEVGAAGAATTIPVAAEHSDGTTYTYTDTDGIESGKTYAYSLLAQKNGETFISDNAAVARTLGTPEPKFSESSLAYDSITVTWPPVQSATKYTVTLDNTSETQKDEISFDSDGASQNESVTATGNLITYKFERPKGYDDAKLSGANWSVTVVAQSDVDTTQNADAITVRTMGPANIGTAAAAQVQDNFITVTWKPVEKAQGYALQRTRYTITENGYEKAKTDLFYISGDKKITYGETQISDNSVMQLEIGADTFTLTDKQKDMEQTGYGESQSMIAWGVPFDYTVVPLLSADDADSAERIEQYKTNLSAATATSATRGYGQNVTASKSDYTDRVMVSWSKPHNAGDTQPTVYKRERGADSWTSCGTPEAGKQSFSDSVTTTGIFEYAVNYNNSGSKFVASYETSLANTLTALGEQKNAGYAFRITEGNFSAEKPNAANETFGETVKWTPWDTSKRKVGPDKYTIYSKNLNNSGDWFEVATIAADGTVTPLPKGKDWYDVAMSTGSDGRSLTITPNGVAEGQTRLLRAGGTTNTATTGTHDGLLKVQRDYKHYYKIKLEHETENNENGSVSFEIGDDNSIYTYRKITDDEFCKNISLIVADAFAQTGLASLPTTGWVTFTTNGKAGKFVIERGAMWGNQMKWGTSGTDYIHIFHDMPSGAQDLSSGYTINTEQVNYKDGAYSYTPYHLAWGTVKVSHETGLPSYTGYYILNASNHDGNKWNCTIQYSHTSASPTDNQKITINTAYPNDTSYNSSSNDESYTSYRNETLFKEWIPLDLGSSYNKAYATYTNERSVYKGTWWEER